MRYCVKRWQPNAAADDSMDLRRYEPRHFSRVTRYTQKLQRRGAFLYHRAAA